MASSLFSNRTFTTALKKANSIIQFIILYCQGLKCITFILKFTLLLSVLSSHKSTLLYNLISSQLVLLTWQKKRFDCEVFALANIQHTGYLCLELHVLVTAHLLDKTVKLLLNV